MTTLSNLHTSSHCCLIVGDHNVGKSSLIQSFITGTFPSKTRPTIGIDSKVSQIFEFPIQGLKLKWFVYEVSGDESYKRPQYKGLMNKIEKEANFIMLVYNPTNQKSFENIEKVWLKMLAMEQNEENEVNRNDKIKILISYNPKTNAKRQIDKHQGENLALRINAKFYEINEGVLDDAKKVFFEPALNFETERTLQIFRRSPSQEAMYINQKILKIANDNISQNGLNTISCLSTILKKAGVQLNMTDSINLSQSLLSLRLLSTGQAFQQINSVKLSLSGSVEKESLLKIVLSYNVTPEIKARLVSKLLLEKFNQEFKGYAPLKLKIIQYSQAKNQIDFMLYDKKGIYLEIPITEIQRALKPLKIKSGGISQRPLYQQLMISPNILLSSNTLSEQFPINPQQFFSTPNSSPRKQSNSNSPNSLDSIKELDNSEQTSLSGWTSQDLTIESGNLMQQPNSLYFYGVNTSKKVQKGCIQENYFANDQSENILNSFKQEQQDLSSSFTSSVAEAQKQASTFKVDNKRFKIIFQCQVLSGEKNNYQDFENNNTINDETNGTITSAMNETSMQSDIPNSKNKQKARKKYYQIDQVMPYKILIQEVKGFFSFFST